MSSLEASDAGRLADFGLLSPVSASPAVAALTGDRAVLAAILRVEAAWAAVLDEAGLAPAGSAAVVAAAADAGRYDLADIAVRAQGGANPVIPLLADLRAQVKALDTAGIGAGRAVHTSLTSQDVLDSALETNHKSKKSKATKKTVASRKTKSNGKSTSRRR